MALMNMSFNLKGHLIVNTPRPAVAMFQQSGMDVFVIGDFVVQR